MRTALPSQAAAGQREGAGQGRGGLASGVGAEPQEEAGGEEPAQGDRARDVPDDRRLVPAIPDPVAPPLDQTR